MLLRISTLGSFRRVVHPFFAVFLSSPCPLNLSAVLLWIVFSPAAAGVGPRLQLPAAVSEFVGASCQVKRGETLSGARIAPLPLARYVSALARLFHTPLASLLLLVLLLFRNIFYSSVLFRLRYFRLSYLLFKVW